MFPIYNGYVNSVLNFAFVTVILEYQQETPRWEITKDCQNIRQSLS